MELEKLLLETWKFFNRFLNTMSTDDKYSLISRDNWMQTIQLRLAEKQNIFSRFSSAFFKSVLSLEQFQKKLTLIAYVFPNLLSTKEVLR